MTRHAMLVIAQTAFDKVEIPGREPLRAAPGLGVQAAHAWWTEHEQPAATTRREEYAASLAGRLEDWDAETEIEFGKGRLHDGGPRVDIAQLTFPDGSTDVAPLDLAAEYVAQAFRARNPEPSLDAQFRAWLAAVTITQVGTWEASLHSGGTSAPVDIGQAAPAGFPAAAVVACLDKLSADGWQVAQVSEDRRLFAGALGTSETAVITVRYLLTAGAPAA